MSKLHSSLFYGALALLMSPAAHAQTRFLSSQTSSDIRIETAGKFTEQSTALLSELLACVATDSPTDKLKKITDDLAAVKATKQIFASHREKIIANITEAQLKIKQIDQDLAIAASAKPKTSSFNLVSDALQTAKPIHTIANEVTKEFSYTTSRVVEIVNRSTYISFTDSKGVRRFANAADVRNLDPEQRAVLEAVSLSWLTAPAQLTSYEFKTSGRQIAEKNKLRLAKVDVMSLSDGDSIALASGANSLISKANILIENSRGQSIPRLGKEIADYGDRLSRSLITTDATAAKLNAELTEKAKLEQLDRNQVMARALEKDQLMQEVARLSIDADSFYKRMVASDAAMKRIETEFARCSKKLAVTTSVAQKAHDFLDEDAKEYAAKKAREAAAIKEHQTEK